MIVEIDGEKVDAQFACSIDEKAQGEPDVSGIAQKFADTCDSLARAVIDSREMLTLGLYPSVVRVAIGNILSLLAYACEVPARRKRTVMDVEKMVNDWVPLVKKLALAHDVDEKDAASSALDDLLVPVISAPVAQIRSFYRKLTDRLKNDKEVPLFLYRLFEFWGENVLDKVSKEEMVGLKKEIASRIAERSMEEIPKQDWIDSMIGALQWRSPEKLEEIESNLKAGHKPRVRGKESCLFIEVGEAQVML